MQTKTFTPLFTTERLDETKAFYTSHLGFDVFYEIPDAYVALRSGGDGGPLIAFMRPDGEHEKPAAGAGLFYCLEVEDVDGEHARLMREGVAIESAPEDKPWGDRATTLLDPNGITVYLHRPVETPQSAG